MSYVISFDILKSNCKHFYQVNTGNSTMERCKILTKTEFNGLLNELHNLEGMHEVDCTELKCPILKKLQIRE